MFLSFIPLPSSSSSTFGTFRPKVSSRKMKPAIAPTPETVAPTRQGKA